jgi:hypothetical protein
MLFGLVVGVVEVSVQKAIQSQSTAPVLLIYSVFIDFSTIADEIQDLEKVEVAE